jgi:hypothetical protein
MPRAIRRDFKFKLLPAKLQADIFRHIRKSKTKDVIRSLADKHKIEVRPTTLSVFFRWYPGACPLGMVRMDADDLRDAEATNPNLMVDGKKASDMDQLTFERITGEKMRCADFIRLRNLRLVDEATQCREQVESRKFELDRRRLQLAEKKAEQAQVAETPTLTPEETDQKIKELWGLK